MTNIPNKIRSILAVDDDRGVLSVIKDQLEREGYTVLTAQSGAEALRVLQTTTPLVVLLDLGLPQESGFDVLARIKKFKPELQVVMVTGSHKEEEARRAFELGAWDYVTKPIDFNYLRGILLFHV